MKKSCLQVSETTIYRDISDELLVIQLETGLFYYFNPKTKTYLDFFKQPRPFSNLLLGLHLDEDAEECEYLKGFCDFLLKNQILVTVEIEAELTEEEEIAELKYNKPIFLRKGEKTLDEVTFLCP